MNFEEKIIERLKRLEREVERLRVKESPAGGSGVTDHGALTGLSDDDHSQYLSNTRHDDTARHTLGTVVPHDDHGALSGLADDDHSQYLNNTRHDATARHTLGTVVPHDDHGALTGLSDNDHPQYLLAATGKAADSDKLDGIDSTGFATAGHDHDGRYYTETEVNSYLALKADKTVTFVAGNGLSGGGDLSANRTFDVSAGLGIDFDVNGAVIVDLTENYAWTGNHSFAQTMYAGSIMPHVSDTYDLGSFTSMWRKIFASELSAVVFAKYEQVLLGGWFTVSKGEGVLLHDVLSTDTKIDLGIDFPFTANDIIVFRGISGGSPQVEYIRVLSLSIGTTFNVTRDVDGSGANNWVTGTVYAIYGQAGNGRIELNAYDSPRLSVFSHANTIAGFREQVRIGDLINGWGYSASTYGGAFGSYESGKANITIDPTNGIRIRNYDQTVIQLTGTEASFENVIKLGTYARLEQGTGTWGTNFTGSAIWNESGVMNIGGWNNNVQQWWGGSDGKLYAGEGDIILDNAGIKLHNNDTHSGAGRIDFYDAYNNHIGAMYGWGDTATPLTMHSIMINAFDEQPTQIYTPTEIKLLAESFAKSEVMLQAAEPGYYGEQTNTSIRLTKDYNGNNIQMYGNVAIGDPTVVNNLDLYGNLVVDGTIKDGDDNEYGRPVFLTTPLTSTAWDGDNKGIADRAIVDLSAVFGVPAGVKAVLMSIQTTGDAANDYIRFGPNSTYNYALTCRTTVASQISHASGIVPCDANGDVYCYTSGTVESVYVWIWGYWL